VRQNRSSVESKEQHFYYACAKMGIVDAIRLEIAFRRRKSLNLLRRNFVQTGVYVVDRVQAAPGARTPRWPAASIAVLAEERSPTPPHSNETRHPRWPKSDNGGGEAAQGAAAAARAHAVRGRALRRLLPPRRLRRQQVRRPSTAPNPPPRATTGPCPTAYTCCTLSFFVGG
jgi:hypothetical protein